MVQPRKTRPSLTERLLMGRKESNQTKQKIRTINLQNEDIIRNISIQNGALSFSKLRSPLLSYILKYTMQLFMEKFVTKNWLQYQNKLFYLNEILWDMS